jgi:hypothetical protein
MGDAISAYLELEQELGTREQRDRLLQAGHPAEAEQRGLLELEDSIEAGVRKKLA